MKVKVKFLQQVDHWLRDVGGAGNQQQGPGDPNNRSRGTSKNPEDFPKQGDSRRPERSQNLEELGERGDPAGTRDPEPPPVSASANGATRITGDFISLSSYHHCFSKCCNQDYW